MCSLLSFKHWQRTHTFFKTLWAKQNISGDQIQSAGSQPFTTEELSGRLTGCIWGLAPGQNLLDCPLWFPPVQAGDMDHPPQGGSQGTLLPEPGS